MKTSTKKPLHIKPTLVLTLLLLQLSLTAQVQWYQNQDGSYQLPNSTVGTSIQSFTPHSFIACYLWSTNNDEYTWKISKSNINGTEQRQFFITGVTAMVETKPGRHNSLFILEQNFPMGQNAEYILFKLDSNLNIKAQRNITFPNGFIIFNLNAFETDDDDNVYLAGDGQYPDGPGFSPASFVLKTDKNLVNKWSRIDHSQTSFAQLHIDRNGNVLVIADFYTFFPDVHIIRISANGQLVQTKTIHTDPGRFSLFSLLDDDDNLLLYGGKSIANTTQAMYLYKISRNSGNIIYSKTLFTEAGMQLNDLKLDRDGNIFSLVTLYPASGGQVVKISRINPGNGNIYWNHSFPFEQDSCYLAKLVVNESDRFYVVGERMSGNYFSKGFVQRMKKNGQTDGDVKAPDSVSIQRSHLLIDGIIDRYDQLIAIGSANDFDTKTFTSTYQRAFAAGYRIVIPGCGTGRNSAETVIESKTGISEEVIVSPRLVVYPNPVQTQLIVSNLDPSEYDKISVYNMQGALLLQQPIYETFTKIDVNNLIDGVYLLTLRSTVSLKEKTIKFVVKK